MTSAAPRPWLTLAGLVVLRLVCFYDVIAVSMVSLVKLVWLQLLKLCNSQFPATLYNDNEYTELVHSKSNFFLYSTSVGAPSITWMGKHRV